MAREDLALMGLIAFLRKYAFELRHPPVQDAAEWLEAAAVNLRIAYKFKGRIRVTVEGQGGDGTGGRIPAAS